MNMNNFGMLSSDLFMSLVEAYKNLGPIAAIGITFIEAFFPFLPLSAFVMANAAAFGLFAGLLFSWIGSCLGILCIYGIFRYFGGKPFLQKFMQRKEIIACHRFIGKHEATFIIVLCALPVFPRFLVAVVAGIRKTNFKLFAVCSALGTIIFFFILSIVGTNLSTIITSPIKIVMFLAALVLIGSISKIFAKVS
ncbi:MAG: TVP38/TMEM64 family protein [Bacillaceae bacterium]